MDKDKQLFNHKFIDDDIDQFLSNQSSLSSDPNARLVYELHHIYKEDAQSLDRVQMRLERYIEQQRTSQKPRPKLRQSQEASSHPMPFRRIRGSAKYPTNRLFTVLAAALVGLFLVSSLAWVLAMTAPTTTPLGTSMNVSALPTVTSVPSQSDFVELTVHNDESGQTNYFTLTYKGNDGNIKEHVVCQSIPPLNWVDVESSPGEPAQVPRGQTVWLRYYHNAKCDPSSMFMSVNLPIPTVPRYNHCWFNPDETDTPNWSGCIRPSQILSISWH